jgi:imidazolonepropionase
MVSILIEQIPLLVTNDSSHDGTVLGIIHDAAMVVEDGMIAWVGNTTNASRDGIDQLIDATNRCVIPGFVDSHTHLVFGGDRSQEFSARMRGEKYAPGGIAATVAATRSATDSDLRKNALFLFNEALVSGTTTIEIKSGYGLTVVDEKRSLEIARALTPESTFLGGHVVPVEYQNDVDGYVDLVCGEMLGMAVPFAKWIDVFCDRGAFTPEQARKILTCGVSKGLLPRLHANQLEEGAGIAIGVELDCASVDHVTYASDSDLALLERSNTVATLLPGAEFSTRSKYPDARRFLEAGITLAIASDCNPGSSYSTSMPFMIAIAVRDMYFSPEQALWSATRGGAQALRRDDVGQLAVGSKANFLFLKSPTYIHLAYRPGVQLIDEVWRNGIHIQ